MYKRQAGRHALSDEKIGDTAGAALGQRLVVGIGTDAVGMPDNPDRDQAGTVQALSLIHI